MRTALNVLVATAVIAAMTGLGATTASAQDVKIRMANWLPPVHHLPQTIGRWIKSVNEASGGAIAISFDAAPLAKPPGQYELAKKGIADIAYHVLGYTLGRFQVLRGTELPFLSPNATIGSQATWDWYARNVGTKETDDVKLLTVWVHGPGLLHTKKKVTRLEDLKGVKLRVGGGGVATAEFLGAVPVAMSATKAHESLQRGTTEGAFFPWEAVKGFRLAKLTGHHLEIQGGLYTTPFALVMNKKRFDGLPASARKVLDDIGGLAGAKQIGAGWDGADVAGRAAAQENGNQIRTISPGELKRWRAAVNGQVARWIGTVNKLGWNGADLLTDLRNTMEKFQAMN